MKMNLITPKHKAPIKTKLIQILNEAVEIYTTMNPTTYTIIDKDGNEIKMKLN